MQRRNKLSFDSSRNVSLKSFSISYINQTDSNGGTLCEWIVISYDCVSQKPNSNPTGGKEISADLTGPRLGRPTRQQTSDFPSDSINVTEILSPEGKRIFTERNQQAVCVYKVDNCDVSGWP